MFEMLWESTGLSLITWRELVMYVIIVVLLYLGIYRKYEPLLIPIAFGAFNNSWKRNYGNKWTIATSIYRC